MKFKNEEDKLLFLSEISLDLDINTEITESMISDLYSSRFELINLIGRDSYLLGSKLVRESLLTKKTRISKVILNFLESRKLDNFERIEVLKSLSSLNTHILIEMGYYHSLYEDIELHNLYDRYSILFNDINKNLLVKDKIELRESYRYLLKSLI